MASVDDITTHIDSAATRTDDALAKAQGTATETEKVAVSLASAKSEADALSQALTALGAEGRAREAAQAAVRAGELTGTARTIKSSIDTSVQQLSALKSDESELRVQVEALRGLLRAATSTSEASPTPIEASDGPSTTRGAAEPVARPFRVDRRNKECVDALKRVGWPKNAEGKTVARGILYDNEGNPVLGRTLKALEPGNAYTAPELRQPWRSDTDMTTTWHIEGGAAAFMRGTEAKQMALYLNIPPCGGPDRPDPQGCHENLPKILPEGYTVFVHVVQENGGYRRITAKGTGEALR